MVTILLYMGMGILTNQQINKYYDKYKDIEVTFTKNVIAATRLLTKHVYLKCLGTQWPCIIYSTSMTGAKIIVNLDPASFELIRKANNLVSLDLPFMSKTKGPGYSFCICQGTGFSQYNKSNPSFTL